MARPYGPDRLAARKARLERHAGETDPEVVINAAARFLEARQRSVHEVRRHLEAAAYPAALIDAALARLVELGWLDDVTFARSWVESRDRAHPRGGQALRRELAQKGVEREVIEAALEERGVDASEADPDDRGEVSSADELAARRLLGKKAASLARIADPAARRQRAYGLLARNGFDPGVCRDVSQEFTRALGDTGTDFGEA